MTCPSVSGPFRRQGILSALVDAALLGQGYAFALALPDQGALKFGEAAHDQDHEIGHGGVLADGQPFFEELDPHPPPGSP